MRLQLENVKEEIKARGWSLLSEDYINLKTDLEIRCPEGHLNFVPLEKWRHESYECPICKNNRFFKQENIAVKKNGYRILAFDQASITTGWSVFDDKELIKFGKWTSQGEHSTQRISQAKQWIASMIEKWKPDEVILEDIQLQSFGANGQAVTVYKKLAHLQGVLNNYLYESGMKFKVVSPATWRHHSQIKGKSRTELKRSAQLKVKELYDISATQDESDSILIGAWAASQHLSDNLIF